MNKFTKNNQKTEEKSEDTVKKIENDNDYQKFSNLSAKEQLLFKYFLTNQDDLNSIKKIIDNFEKFAIFNQKDLNDSISSEDVKLSDPFNESFSTSATDQKEANIETTSIIKTNVEAIGQIKLLNPDLTSSNLTDAILEVNKKTEFPNIKFATGENVDKTNLSQNGRGYLLRLGDKKELDQKISDNSLIIDNLSKKQTETEKDVDDNTKSINKNIIAINDNTEDIDKLNNRMSALENVKTELPIGTVLALVEVYDPNDYLSGIWERYNMLIGSTLISTSVESELGDFGNGKLLKHNHLWASYQRYHTINVNEGGSSEYGPLVYFRSYDIDGNVGQFGDVPDNALTHDNPFIYTSSIGTTNANLACGVKVFFWKRIS